MTAVTHEVDFSHRRFSVAETAEHLRVSKAFIFKLIREGKLKGSKLGRRTIITGREIERALAENV
jgi:excisionase family DNA binding protein